MDYYGLQSIISSQKKQVPTGKESDSFFTIKDKNPAYVEPKFSKVEKFPVEKPAVILVSAVGASGKTTAAHSFSADTGMPILDLSRHKPVGDNTLSGILMDYYPDSISEIRRGLTEGTSGLIIDGIDEGRSKVTEEAFEAFLDDVVKRTEGSLGTSIVILGRSQTLINTWCYLVDRGVDVGLVQIDPFDMDQAKSYIDIHVGECQPAQRAAYEKARDEILNKLGAAFDVAGNNEDTFIKFLGYPPVLDAISTLLCEEKNHHKIYQSLNKEVVNNTEVNLLIQIGDYLLDRDQREKALPNFANDIADKVGGKIGETLKSTLFNREEQCARVLATSMGLPFEKKLIADPGINQEYENSIERWCSEHPFLQNNELRNPVFSAIAVARCICSEVDEYKEVAATYAQQNPQTYHLLYIMDAIKSDGDIHIGAFNMIIQSCVDFLGANATVSIDIDGSSWDETDHADENELSITIGVNNNGQERSFDFKAETVSTGKVILGPNLINARITLPCDAILSGSTTLNTFGDCSLSAKSIEFKSPEILISRLTSSNQVESAPGNFIIETGNATGHVDNIAPKDGQLEILCLTNELDYPLVKYVKKVEVKISNDIKHKYKRLRKIITLFRSHSKGSLARFKDKINHIRVIKNDEGRAVLKALLDSGILTQDHKMYYIDQEKFSKILGVNWTDLRSYGSSEKLLKFLKNIT